MFGYLVGLLFFLSPPFSTKGITIDCFRPRSSCAEVFCYKGYLQLYLKRDSTTCVFL